MTALSEYWRSSAADWLGLAGFEAMLTVSRRGMCHGDRIRMADSCLVPQICSAWRLGIDMAQFPRILIRIETLEAVPAVAAARPDQHKP